MNRFPIPAARRRVATVVLFLAVTLASGCAHAPSTPGPRGARASGPAPAGASAVTEIQTGAEDSAARRPPQLFPGTGKLIGAPAPRSVTKSSPGTGVQLQFVDTEIAVVVASVIGDGVGAPYSVDPQVKGTMTLQSNRPLATEELVPTLEAALQTVGVALVVIDGTYRAVPLKDAPRAARGIRGPGTSGTPGYGVQIIGLQFVGAAEMQKVLEPFAPSGGILRVDESRNLLIVAGTSHEIQSMLDVVQTFDVDWLAGMSFGLYHLSYVDAKTLSGELSEIFADPRSPLNGIVRLIPIPRLNAIMVVTAQSRYLDEVERWIERLDLGGSAPGRRIYVYDVQNAKAGDLARSLNKILALAGGDTSDTTTTTGASMTSSNPMSTGTSSLGSARSTGLSGGGSTFGSSRTTSTQTTVQQGSRSDSAMDTGGIRIVPNDENNSLLILASPSEFGVIDSTLKRLDVPPRQVLIEATLAEVTLTDELRYGVQWSYQNRTGPIVLSQSSGGGVAQAFPGFSYLYNASTDVSAVLNAIESVTKVHVLSNPKLMVLNNREAQLQIGDQVPVTVASALSTGAGNAPIVNSVEFRDTGVILHVTPRVNQNGLVQLDITQEVSDVVKTTTSGIDSPTIQQRKISSTVSVRSGETIALGGLIRENVTKSKSGLPFLSKIPLIGGLFGNSDTTKDRTELIVLITPRVVRNDDELQDTMEYLRRQFRALPFPKAPTKQP